MERTTKPFPQAVKDLLDEHDISQRELARRTSRNGGPRIAAVNQIVRGKLGGKSAPNKPETMEQIARAFGLSPDYFAEYRLRKARDKLDPDKVGLKQALRNKDEEVP